MKKVDYFWIAGGIGLEQKVTTDINNSQIHYSPPVPMQSVI